MRRLLVRAVYWAHDDRDRGVVHSRYRYFQDRAVVLGLLGRGLVGFAGPDSELQRSEKNMETASENVRFYMCGEGKGGFFFHKVDMGLTMVVRAVFPEGLPFPEIERHAALGVDYHRQ
jgi:hypothetical protein